MKIVFKLALAAVTLGTIVCPVLFAQTSPAETIHNYFAVGRIKWSVPASFEHSFGPPHYTMGPRILCKGELRHCEISVGARDITIEVSKRRAAITAELSQYVSRSKEKALQFRTYGTAPEVHYVTITDTRPAPGEFVLLTQGFSVNGTAVINFLIQSNDPNDVRKILEIVQSARTIDALPAWAWKLSDYQSVCAERFPEHKAANDAAFKSSPFASVDIFGIYEKEGKTREEVLKGREASRKSYADIFNQKPESYRVAVCKNFPQWVALAAKDLPAK
ncbi:MAG: hypothetical protein WAM70_06435 [Pyrinomonadaceae bacterium]